MITWEQTYDLLGIKDFMLFIGSNAIQNTLFPIKLVFILFTAFFFCALMYYYLNSTYLRYKFLEDVFEFLTWQAVGTKEFDRRWRGIMKRIDTDSEKEYKLAIMEADDFLKEALEDADFEGKTVEELLKSAGKRIVPNTDDIVGAHQIRNVIVHDVNYRLDINSAKKILSDYEKAIRGAYTA